MIQEIDFVDEREHELYVVARLGEDVREFLRAHPVGKYIHERTKIMVKQAEVDALEVDPDGWSWFRARNKLRQIRHRADVARGMINLLAEAILEGDIAAEELESYREK
jgi:hypothetical protein